MVTVLGSGSNKKILNSITPILISASLDVRISLCDLLDTIAANDSSMYMLVIHLQNPSKSYHICSYWMLQELSFSCVQAKILRELNATSDMEMGGLDYDTILAAYDKVNLNFFYPLPEEHTKAILAHSVHDMSSGDLILRQSALRLLLSFIEFSSEILNGSLESDHIWSKTSIKDLVNKFILKHMGNAMDKDGPIKKVVHLYSLFVAHTLSPVFFSLIYLVPFSDINEPSVNISRMTLF